MLFDSLPLATKQLYNIAARVIFGTPQLSSSAYAPPAVTDMMPIEFMLLHPIKSVASVLVCICTVQISFDSNRSGS